MLAISLVGVVTVSNWGLPAIQEMQAGVQERAALEQFRNLDATIQQLVSGTAGQTALKWQPQIDQGSVDVNESADRWLVTGDTTASATTFVNWTGLSDYDNRFDLVTTDSIANAKIHAWVWNSGSKTELNVSSTNGSPCTQWTGTLNATPSSHAVFYLFENRTDGACNSVPIFDTVLSFQVNSESGGTVTTYAVAYLVDVGHVHWTSPMGLDARHVYDSNGALLLGPIDALVPQSLLGVPAPRDFTNSTGGPATSVFVRLVKLQGNASFSAVQGAVQHSVVLGIVGSFTLGNTDNMRTASVYVWGDTRAGIDSALNDTSSGYRFNFTNTGQTGEMYQSYLELTRAMNLAVVYSDISVEG